MYQKMMANITTINQNHSFGETKIPWEIHTGVSELVERIEHLLTEVTYDGLVDRIINHDGFVDHLSKGEEDFNVIPGTQKVACTRMTLALSTGVSVSNSLGFPCVMRSVREYLIDCEKIAKAVVLLTDTWSPRHVEEHIADVRAHARQGRFVVPHLVTGCRILRVDWPRI